jgi:hypothetical protein
MDIKEFGNNRYVRFLFTKFMISLCFGAMLVFDFGVVVVGSVKLLWEGKRCYTPLCR